MVRTLAQSPAMKITIYGWSTERHQRRATATRSTGAVQSATFAATSYAPTPCS